MPTENNTDNVELSSHTSVSKVLFNVLNDEFISFSSHPCDNIFTSFEVHPQSSATVRTTFSKFQVATVEYNFQLFVKEVLQLYYKEQL